MIIHLTQIRPPATLVSMKHTANCSGCGVLIICEKDHCTEQDHRCYSCIVNVTDPVIEDKPRARAAKVSKP
jgi:hypothetical protein